MTFKFFAFMASLLFCLQMGCASKGFNRGELRDQIGITKPVVDDKEIAAALSKKPNLPKPFKVAVYLKAPASTPVGARWTNSQAEWFWEESDKEIIASIAKELKAEGLVADVFPLVSSVISKEDIKSLRLVAAQHGADALIIIGGAGAVDRYANNWGLSYFLIAPTLFVKGSEADTLFIANAVMYDVRNEFLYFTTEAEVQTNESYIPAFDRPNKVLLREAKKAALEKLKVGIKDMVAGKKI